MLKIEKKFELYIAYALKIFCICLWFLFVIIWCLFEVNCEIIAIRENFVDRPESYDLFSAKSCIFLVHEKTRTVWGYISPSPYTTCPKARYQNIPKTFSYYSRTITNLTNIWLRPEQPWKSHIWIFRLSFAIFEILMFGHVAKGSQLWKACDGMRVAGKCLRIFLILALG
jgi:hypothetical protein